MPSSSAKPAGPPSWLVGLVLEREMRAERCRIWWAERAKEDSSSELYSAFSKHLDQLDREFADALAKTHARLERDEPTREELAAETRARVDFVRAGLNERMGAECIERGRTLRRETLAHASVGDDLSPQQRSTIDTPRDSRLAEVYRKFRFEWSRGFIESARYDAPEALSFAALAALFDLPVARRLKKIACTGSADFLQSLIHALMSRPRLHLEDVELECVSIGPQPDLDPLEDASLLRLSVRDGSWPGGSIGFPQLERLDLRADALTEAMFDAILSQPRLALGRLGLGQGVAPYLARQWAQLLSGDHFPNLAELAIELSWDGDRLLRGIVEGRLVDRLSVLDLRCVQPGPLVSIDDDAHRLAHLDRLLLPPMSFEHRHRIRSVLPKARFNVAG